MGPRGRLTAAILLAAVAAVAWLAVPRRFEVEGVSMGPAFLPGDVVRTGPFPAFDRLRRPRRFDRWVLAATDGLVIKRVVGLPDEEISIPDGDLSIGGRTVLKGPSLLAELGCILTGDAADSAAETDPGWAWSRPAGEVLDDAPFDAGAPRVLATVGDVGLAAVVAVRDAEATNPATLRIRVGDTVTTRSLAEPGRHAVVAGRLDGRLVLATWPVPPDAPAPAARSCLPPAPPEAWQVADPWPGGSSADQSAPALAIGGGDDRVAVVTAARWRDVAWRAGADGRSSWALGADEVLVFGDHPAASTDSRRWGPVKAATLRYRITFGSRASDRGHIDHAALGFVDGLLAPPARCP